ncbi:hypothetical protein MTO96_024275 [Rhipicephalus appendiculatus]
MQTKLILFEHSEMRKASTRALFAKPTNTVVTAPADERVETLSDQSRARNGGGGHFAATHQGATSRWLPLATAQTPVEYRRGPHPFPYPLKAAPVLARLYKLGRHAGAGTGPQWRGKQAHEAHLSREGRHGAAGQQPLIRRAGGGLEVTVSFRPQDDSPPRCEEFHGDISGQCGAKAPEPEAAPKGPNGGGGGPAGRTDSPPEPVSLPIRDDYERRLRLAMERRREYNDFLSRRPRRKRNDSGGGNTAGAPRRTWNTSDRQWRKTSPSQCRPKEQSDNRTSAVSRVQSRADHAASADANHTASILPAINGQSSASGAKNDKDGRRSRLCNGTKNGELAVVATLKEETAKLKEEREEFAKLVSLGSFLLTHAC